MVAEDAGRRSKRWKRENGEKKQRPRGRIEADERQQGKVQD